MKTIIITLLLLLAMLRAAVAEETPASPEGKPRIAVLPFEDQTSAGSTLSITSAFSQRSAPMIKWSANKYGRLARGMIETSLSKWEEVTTADRQSLDLLQREIELIKRRGGNMARIIEAKRKAGVTHYLLGELLHLDQHSWTFHEFGLFHSSTTTTARLRLRVIDVAKEDIVYSAESEGRFEVSKTQFGEDQHDDPGGQAVINAVKSLTEEPKFRAELLKALGQGALPERTERRNVEVVFDSLPKGGNIEIGEVYVGTGRISRVLENSERFHVRITKPGFEAWTGTIVAEAGLVVAPELVPLSKPSDQGPNP